MSQKMVKRLKKLSVNKRHYKAMKKMFKSLNVLEKAKLNGKKTK